MNWNPEKESKFKAELQALETFAADRNDALKKLRAALNGAGVSPDAAMAERFIANAAAIVVALQPWVIEDVD